MMREAIILRAHLLELSLSFVDEVTPYLIPRQLSTHLSRQHTLWPQTRSSCATKTAWLVGCRAKTGSGFGLGSLLSAVAVSYSIRTRATTRVRRLASDNQKEHATPSRSNGPMALNKLPFPPRCR